MATLTSVKDPTTIPHEAQVWAEKLQMEEHPEGGFYKQNYKSSDTVDLPGRPPNLFAGTAIIYLMAQDNFSAFHRVQSDEIWHYYDGSSVKITKIDETGILSKIILGIKTGEPQVIIKKNTWFTAKPQGSFALVGCTMAPGFNYAEWEIAKRDELSKQFPQHQQVIEKYTRV